MKRRIFAAMLCVLTFSLFLSFPAMAEDSSAPFTISFTPAGQSQGSAAFDVVLSNTSADSMQASLIDVCLSVTGSFQSFTAKNSSSVTTETGNGIVRLCRTELDSPLSIPEEDSVVLGTLLIAPGIGGQIELAAAAGKEAAVTAPLCSDNMLAEVTPISYTPTGGVTVSGMVQAYNSEYTPEAKLYASADTAHETPLYTAQIGEPQVSGAQYTWSIAFSGVTAGTYDLVVTKAAHLTYTIQSIPVGSDAIDLTAASRKIYQTMNLLVGDITGDGKVNNSDLTVLRSCFGETDADVLNAFADFTGDSKVNNSDLTPFRINFGKIASSDCIYAY